MRLPLCFGRKQHTMALLLNIDTATERAGVCLSNNEQVLAVRQTLEQKNHASFIQPAIKEMLAEADYRLQDVDAVAVSAGPGSYTGLRVGLATAKGICFALQKPLIMLNSLQVMALASIQANKTTLQTGQPTLFCPMIDARRMEVFTALYDAELREVMPPQAMVLDEASLAQQLQTHIIICSGSGSPKAAVIQHPNLVLGETTYKIDEMAVLSSLAFTKKQFADLAYSEPFYLKEFYKPMKKN